MGKKLNIFKTEFEFGGVSLKEKAIFAKDLAIMIKSGLTVAESLEIFSKQSSRNFKKIIAEVKLSLISGNSLASSMEEYPKVFSDFFINSIRAGEASGNLERNFNNIALHLEMQKELRDKMRSVMFYPLIVLFLSIVLGFIIAFIVLPKITPMLSGLKIDLPFTTRMLIWLSDFMKKYSLILFSGLSALVFFSTWLFRQKFFKPVLHYAFLRLPIVKKVSIGKNVAQFSHTLEALLKSGLSIDEALKITAGTADNYYYKKAISKIAVKISLGGKFSENLEKYENLFPAMATNLIRVGERSGNLEEELRGVNRIYQDEVNNAVKLIAIAIEPILLIIIGVIVGGLALSIITPIYKVTGNIFR